MIPIGKKHPDKKFKEKYVLLRNISSLRFSYYDFEKKEWEKEWDFEKRQKTPSFQFSFPVSVKMEIEREAQKSSYVFPVSHVFVRNNRLNKLLPQMFQEEEEQEKEKGKQGKFYWWENREQEGTLPFLLFPNPGNRERN